MSLMLVSALMLAQAPAAVQPAPVQQQKAKKVKPAQVCEMMEVTGSRAKQQVCRDADGNLDLGPGVSGSLSGKGQIHNENGGPGGTGSSGPGGAN